MKTGALIIALLVSGHSWGDTNIEKCTGADGTAYFSNKGCDRGDKWERHQINEAQTVDSSELRAWAQRSPRQIQPYQSRTPNLITSGPQDAIACQNAKRMYEFEIDWKYSKPGAVTQKWNEMQAACR